MTRLSESVMPSRRFLSRTQEDDLTPLEALKIYFTILIGVAFSIMMFYFVIPRW